MPEKIEFIPNAGACLATRTVLDGHGRVRWMVREGSRHPADNGWRFMSHLDTTEDMSGPDVWQITDFNTVCNLEPAIIGIWDLPIGSDLQLVDDELGMRIVETPTGRTIPPDELYSPVR